MLGPNIRVFSHWFRLVDLLLIGLHAQVWRFSLEIGLNIRVRAQPVSHH